MHLVIYTNCDIVPFLLLVQYQGGLSEIEFTVNLFSNTSMVFLPFSHILCISSYIYRAVLSIFVRGHRKVAQTRYVVETLFIILDRYVKLYLFDRVKIVHVRAMAI